MLHMVVGRSTETKHVLVDVHYVYLGVATDLLMGVTSLVVAPSKQVVTIFSATNAISVSIEDEHRAIYHPDIN